MNCGLKRCLSFVTLFMCAISAHAQEATQRHALLVGVDYGTSQHLSYLRHPSAEMNALADILPLVGFGKTDVVVLSSDKNRDNSKTPTVAAMREALNSLTRNRKKSDV